MRKYGDKSHRMHVLKPISTRHGLTREFIIKGLYPAACNQIQDDIKKLYNQIDILVAAKTKMEKEMKKYGQKTKEEDIQKNYKEKGPKISVSQIAGGSM